MQWPPRPGPGLKLMNPNGLVAAASTTSQTSIPIRSQSCASSFTSAMLTERKMFSSSFVSSAASGDETGWTVSTTPPYSSGATGALVRDPADDLRHRLRRPVLVSRVDALGREGEVEVGAGLQPGDLLQERLDDVARRAGVGRRLEDDELAR